MPQKIKLAFGAHPLEIDQPENLVQILTPNFIPGCADYKLGLEIALNEPIASKKPEQLYKPGMKVCFIIADKTRVFPKSEMILALLNRLKGIRDQDVIVIVGAGSHPLVPVETAGIGPEITNRFECLFHCSFPQDDFVQVGTTSRGTPVKINPKVASADLIFGIGQVKPHFQAGYSAGAKAILPGVSALETILKNHLMMSDPRAMLGIIKGNPFREDIDEVHKFLPNFYIFNTVLNAQAHVVTTSFGHPIEAHRPLVSIARKICQVPAQKADLVIVSAGLPLAINIYQTCKLLGPAAKVCNPGGVIIVASQAGQGLELKEALMKVLYPLGLTKNYLRPNVDLYLVSEAKREDVEQTFFKYASSMDEAVYHAEEKLGPDPDTIIIPDAGMLIPVVDEDTPEQW